MTFFSKFAKTFFSNGHYKILIYISIFVVLFYVNKTFKIEILEDNSSLNLYFSAVFLLVSFFLNAKSMQLLYASFGFEMSFKLSIHAHGLNVLTKYVPGNLWIILGRSGYISEKSSVPLPKSIQINLFWFIIMINLGSLISLPLIFLKTHSLIFSFINLGIFLFSSIFLFENKTINFINSKLESHGYSVIPILPIIKLLPTMFFVLIMHIFILIHFYFLSSQLLGPHDFLIVLLFPFSFVISLFLFIFPGSLGVREGVLSFLLIENGVDSSIAISLAILSRLVFLLVEIVYFIISLASYKLGKHAYQ
mgnify:CR=1 FL=1